MRQGLWVMLGVMVLAGCRPKLDDDQPAWKAPSSLPVFVQEPLAASVTVRATELADEATPALARKDLKTALPLLIESLTVDGSHERARWLLAQTFLGAGLGSSALKLLEPLAQNQKDCGWCLEMLQKAKTDPAFKRLADSAEGHALLADVPDAPLPYVTWAKTLAEDIKNGRFQDIAKYAHPTVPFKMVRACPTCEDPSKRPPETRVLQGANLLVKVASRFDLTRAQSVGIPLTVQGEPVCKERCCTWQVPPMPPTSAALERLCFRPTLPNLPSLTEISLVFTSSKPRPGAPTLN